MRRMIRGAIASLGVLWVVAPAQSQHAPDWTYGPEPKIPPISERMIPMLNHAAADKWPDGTAPQAAQGLRVTAFARGLIHPRWMLVLSNGDVLVAEAASQPAQSWAHRTLAQNLVQRRAGSIAENANRITLLRDGDGDGIAEQRFVLLERLRQPFGMAVVGTHLYVANTDSVVRYDFAVGQTEVRSEPVKLMDLQVGHHWTRALMASRDGTKLYVTVGSGSNIAEKGIEIEKDRAAIHELDLATGKSRPFATGLRNPNGMAFEPTTGALWTVVNERDETGDDVPPDYLTSVQDGGFYGWPYSYWGKHVDPRVKPQRPDLVERAITPDYALGPHTASLGLAWVDGEALPAPFRSGMVIGQHGSWNRSEKSGYRVIFVPFRDGRPSGQPIDVLAGFLSPDNSKAYGRPVGVVVDAKGALLVADDVGDAIWRVSGSEANTGQSGGG